LVVDLAAGVVFLAAAAGVAAFLAGAALEGVFLGGSFKSVGGFLTGVVDEVVFLGGVRVPVPLFLMADDGAFLALISGNSISTFWAMAKAFNFSIKPTSDSVNASLSAPPRRSYSILANRNTSGVMSCQAQSTASSIKWAVVVAYWNIEIKSNTLVSFEIR